MCPGLKLNKGTMIQVHADFNSFPATIALEKQLDSPKNHHKSIFMYRSPLMMADAPAKQIERRLAATKTSCDSKTRSSKESFPDIAWCESDDDEGEWDVCFSDRSKLEDVLSFENRMKTERRRRTQGLVRSRSIHSKLFMLGEDDVPSPLPMHHHHHHQETSSSFFCTNDVNLESLVRISVPHAHVTVSG